jgi:hypothetical protein
MEYKQPAVPLLVPAVAASFGAAYASLPVEPPIAAARPLSADRPDATESPITVPPGRLQLEMSFLDVSWDVAGSPDRTRTIAIAPVLFKFGLADSIDLQLGVDPYTIERRRPRSGGETAHADGFGDLTIRAKFNLWGNDGGDTALALMPYVKAPTADDDLGNGRVEGGLIVPLAVELPDDSADRSWNLGLMAQWDLVYDEARGDHRNDLVHTIVLGRELSDLWAVFAEYAGAARLDGGEDYRGSLNLGATCAITPDTHLDAGVRIGLTPAAEDLGLFAGIALRF